MATDVILVFESLHCTRESDGTGHSEPYIWPALLWVDDNTLATPDLVGVTGPALGNARVVIKSDMRADETADIPASVGMLRLRFEDGLNLRRLIFVVALWEEDETPEAAMSAGFLAFYSELRAAIADNLVALFAAEQAGDNEQKKAIIASIKTRVRDRVQSAIVNALTPWQKVRVFLGTLDLDDIIDSAFGDFAEHPATTPIALSFTDGPSNLYSIQGNLQVLPVHVDRCQAQVDAVKEAQIAVDGVDNAIKELQEELKHAAPREKPGILAQIKQLREEDLVEANAALDDARRALSICRSRTQSPVPDTTGTITNGIGLTQRKVAHEIRVGV